jgi:Ni/Fe-hydrogenase subunit HybB-like protein
MEAGSGTQYIPKWTEVAVTLGIVALGFAIFRFAARYLPIFEKEGAGEAAAGQAGPPAWAGPAACPTQGD